MPRFRVLALCATLALLTADPASAGLRTSDILPLYNGDRAANGLPPAPKVNALMEQGCANHDHYMSRNGLVHGEDPSKPGYTPEGNMQNGAAGGEVIAEGTGWTPTVEPWQTAPIHLFFLFDPMVFQAGYAETDGYVCMRVRANDVAQPKPPPGTFYAWTSDEGPKAVPHAEHAAEAPYTPQQLVGIPASQTTGPNLLVWSGDELGVPVSAAVTGPTGPVAVKLVNKQTRNAIGDGGWFNGGGVIIPVSPLQQRATYNVSVSWANEGAAPQAFSFTTSRANHLSVRFRSHLNRRRIVLTRVVVSTAAPNMKLTLTGPHRRTLHPRVHHGATAALLLAAGKWNACATSGGGTSGYDGKFACSSLISNGAQPLPPQ